MSRFRTGLAGALAIAALTGCGVQPTGVINGGEPATGLTKGMRLYFASDTGLHGVSRPEQELTDLNSALKLLAEGPSESERQNGLVDLVRIDGPYDATGEGAVVALHLPRTHLTDAKSMATGQLVCTLARAQSLLDPSVRPGSVQVTLRPAGKPLGPYNCSQYLES